MNIMTILTGISFLAITIAGKNMTNIMTFVIVLAVLIFVHELGHFIAAKLFNIGVERFSLGFGPRLFGKKIGYTDYRVSLVPLGGYVKLVGEEPDEEIPPEPWGKEHSFRLKPLWQRTIVVIAGPLFNVLLAFILFWAVFSFYGEPFLGTKISSVQKGSPAEKAGLRAGDKVISVNGIRVSSWDELSKAIRESKTETLTIVVQRGNKRLSYNIRPKIMTIKNIFGDKIKSRIIGITAASEVAYRHYPFYTAFWKGILHTERVTKLTVVSFIKLVEGKIPLKTLGGPIMIYKATSEQAQAGMMALLSFVALISINLAIINVLPIPVLDGGHLFFFLIEAITGKPVSDRKKEIAQQVGIVILVLLMAFVFYNDFTRLRGQ